MHSIVAETIRQTYKIQTAHQQKQILAQLMTKIKQDSALTQEQKTLQTQELYTYLENSQHDPEGKTALMATDHQEYADDAILFLNNKEQQHTTNYNTMK